MNNTPAFDALAGSTQRVTNPALDTLFDTLDPVEIDEMIGRWNGDVFNNGHILNVLLTNRLLRWQGKRFVDENRVQALVMSFLGIRFNLPLGSAVLRPIRFRGKLSSSMVYSWLPIIDHFRKVDDQTVMGIMESRGKVAVYFYLRKATEPL